MTKPDLSLRLRTVVNMAGHGKTVADIGCDHGYISICLVMENAFENAIAMDVRKGPLATADANIRKYGMTDKIKTRLSDGLSNLLGGEADTGIIAGMGGPLLIRLLSNDMEKVRMMTMVLQPQSEISSVRQFLRNEKLAVVEEDMVLDEGKYYPMFKVQYMGEDYKLPNDDKWNYEDQDTMEMLDAYGEKLISNKNAVLKEYLKWEQEVTNSILDSFAKDGIENERAAILRHKLEINKMALSYIEG